ncbi:hypothetical protein M422DRAFT_68159 [Sphaerobolus stellatus SS14]|uniref:AP complex subunit beta n=1 Tax=Sphaerobolus stellatus (strain SS14) TaxID=990650 RepID=A0A0C9UG59_SPHS4|nr:hypothetical protein M422DRAFT_68159 [Sphaerobolus stellatus SS14]
MNVPKKGENYELRADLNSEYRDKRKDAIKRVIANMTVGKDVSGLFPDVLKNMQTEDIEQKKLVYLYLMNYAKTQPELVILAVNTFVKDADDPNPLIRALAIRTMGVLRAEKIIDYLCDPLQKCLRDENPYVRKTAAICVAKLYDLKPELAIDNGFIEQLQELISDANPMVVANAVLALTDIHNAAAAQPSSSTTDKPIFPLNSQILSKLLVALNECTEWGRVAILTALARYTATDEQESEHICERVVPQFQHVNGSVVLAAVKVIMIHMRNVKREDLTKQLIRKMAPPLVTLLSSPPEVQWVALRNINLLLQKRSDVLQNEMRVFFCKYNDPLYVKVEKLDIMIRLAGEQNVDALLSELKEYASEVDVDFVRRSTRAIGQCAIKIESAADRCVNVLLELIATKVTYVVQEAVVVMKDIFRKYPSTYEGVIPTLYTFIGQGKYGADAVQKASANSLSSLDDEATSKQRALQNIVNAQNAENLLDFGDDDSQESQLSGLAATTISTTPAATINALQNSANPLDDLVSIFGSSGLGASTSPPPQRPAMGGLGGLSFSPQPASPATPVMSPPPNQAAQAQDDLLGLF